MDFPDIFEAVCHCECDGQALINKRVLLFFHAQQDFALAILTSNCCSSFVRLNVLGCRADILGTNSQTVVVDCFYI